MAEDKEISAMQNVGETAEPVPLPVAAPPGYWQRDNHLSEPVMPMYRSIGYEGFNASMRQVCADFGTLIETIEWREIGGWEYMRTVPLGGEERRTPPAWLLAILGRVNPLLRSRVKTCIEAIRSDRAGQLVRLWYDEWKPAQIARIAELSEVDCHLLSDTALDEHIGSLVSFFRKSTDCHHRLMVAGIPLAALAFACREMLGWDDARAMELLSGLSEKSSEPSRRLAELARMAAGRPSVRTFLEKGDFDRVDNLAEVDPEFAVAFNAYQREFGCRGLHYTFHRPTLAERPGLTLKLIREHLLPSFDMTADAAALEKRRAAALEQARAALAGHTAGHRERFERALAGAKLAYPVREDNVFYTHNVPFGLVRYGLLELGSRLCQRGQTDSRDDVFYLEVGEAREAFRSGGERKDLVARRRAERAWAEAHPGPASYGKDPGPYPSFAGFPSEVKFAMNALIWYTECVFAGDYPGKQRPAEDSRLGGIAASPGRYTGPARIVMSEAEFEKLQTGDVLVCPVTSPAWSVLFPRIGALVTDTGGALSHPAIIAREYGIPAVVATGNATSFLQDGRSVTVDGSVGVVDIRA